MLNNIKWWLYQIQVKSFFKQPEIYLKIMHMSSKLYGVLFTWNLDIYDKQMFEWYTINKIFNLILKYSFQVDSTVFPHN
jgi:hypothetical protein